MLVVRELVMSYPTMLRLINLMLLPRVGNWFNYPDDVAATTT